MLEERMRNLGKGDKIKWPQADIMRKEMGQIKESQ